MSAEGRMTTACEWCGRAIQRSAHRGTWLAVKGAERGYDPSACDAREDGFHAPAEGREATAREGGAPLHFPAQNDPKCKSSDREATPISVDTAGMTPNERDATYRYAEMIGATVDDRAAGRQTTHVCTPHCDDERGHYPAPGREATVTCPYCGGTGEDPSGVGGMCHDCLGSGTIKTPPARETPP